MNTTTDVLAPSVERHDVVPQTANWSALRRYFLVLSQLALAGLVVHAYAIENATFQRLFWLTVGGFAISMALPMAYRLRFFVALSLVGATVTFGLADAGWLVGCGVLLIGICHLPISLPGRVAALMVTGGLLAVARQGIVAAPWSAAVWPILGSMFMFRLALYLIAAKGGRPQGNVWSALAYFFMLPNLVFPLFPVVDYQTFRRTYYDRSAPAIYEQGLLWISRGIVHLVLYRVVYHSVLNDPADVERLGDLVQFMVGTFLLYLRVSGQFHLVVGLLHLFGFRLPETHKLYYLAHSFTELWRRINIYWTDFMMKAVFYPCYFRVKRLGPVQALVVSTIAVFATTWVLHSYQWFWLRGGFPITPQDVLFWGILGGLVVVGAVRELKAVKRPRPTGGRWSWRLAFRAAATFGAFCFLWSLWSTESIGQWFYMLAAAANVDARGVILLVLTLGTVGLLGGFRADNASSATRWSGVLGTSTVRTVTPLLILVAAAQPAVREAMPYGVADALVAMQTTGLNAHDAALQHRGYYEQLEVRAQPNAQVLDALGRRAEGWQDLAATGALRERRDLLTRDLWPSRRVVWNGHEFTTNRWGMRDRDYSKEKPPGTLRIALLGPSHVMGNGVADGETFENLVEDRLNRERLDPRFARIEILNFGVDGFSLAQQVAILEDRVLGFSPDIVVATYYQRNLSMTEGYLTKLVWRDIPIPDQSLRALLKGAGLSDIDRVGLPVPFAAGRQLASWIGIDSRMPSGEASVRVRRIADEVQDWSIRRFADVTRSHGVVPIVVGLNAVIEDELPEMPHRAVMNELGLPVIDLFNIFPKEDRSSLRVAPWDDHPNVAGHRLIADRLYPQLVALLGSAKSGPAGRF